MIRDIIFVGFFSWIGVLVRIGLGEFYDHTFIHGNIHGPITRSFYPNMVGCAIMGALVSSQSRIKARFPSLYVGLTSGLCGSITTFSGISQEASLELIDHNVTSFFAVLLVGLICPYWILQFFINLIVYLFPVPVPSSAPIALATSRASHQNISSSSSSSSISNNNNNNNNNESIPNYGTISGRLENENNENEDDTTRVATAPEVSNTRPVSIRDKIFYILSVILGLSIFLMLALLIAYLSPAKTWVAFSCLFAPFGAIVRWFFAAYNLKFPKFPLFTFIINFFGSLFLAAFEIWQLHSSVNSRGYSALTGAITGFCGCLTTISTFENEARILDTKYSVLYVIVSIFGTQAFLLLLNGLYYWL